MTQPIYSNILYSSIPNAYKSIEISFKHIRDNCKTIGDIQKLNSFILSYPDSLGYLPSIFPYYKELTDTVNSKV